MHDCGYAYRHKELHINRPGGLPFYVFVYFRTAAQVLLPCDAGPAAAKGSYILFAPNRPQRYCSAGSPYVNDWVHFSEEGESLIGRLGLPVGKLVPFKNDGVVASAVRSLQELAHMDIPRKEEIAHHELSALLLRLHGSGSAKNSPSCPQHYASLAAIRSGLYADPQPGTRIKDLAARANMSETYFQKAYKGCFHCTVGEDIIRGRLERARYLLESSGYSVAQIGAMSGYESEAHFIRQYKVHMGATPGKYRQRTMPTP